MSAQRSITAAATAAATEVIVVAAERTAAVDVPIDTNSPAEHVYIEHQPRETLEPLALEENARPAHEDLHYQGHEHRDGVELEA